MCRCQRLFHAFSQRRLLLHPVAYSVDDGMEVARLRRHQSHGTEDTLTEERTGGRLTMPIGEDTFVSSYGDEFYQAPFRRMPLHTARRTRKKILYDSRCIKITVG